MHTRLRHAAIGIFGVTLVGAGCSAIVPSDVPAFQCTPNDPTACPPGLACDPTTLLCVAELTDADGGDDGSEVDEDATADSPKVLAPLGGACVVNGDCATGLVCGTSTLLTTAIVPANSQSICTSPCCTTSDCAAGFVCFSGATGGSYCVAADKADRAPAAGSGKTGGQTCGAADECASGLCAGRCQNAPGVVCTSSADCPSGTCSGTRRCVDTCCSPSDCASGSTCRILTVSSHVTWGCGAANTSATKDLNAACTETTECKNDNCVGFPEKRCTPPCCKSSDCAALGFNDYVCAYGQAGNDRLKWCFEPADGADAAIGAACTNDFDCASHYCDGELRKCMKVCCTDDDCAKDEACRPSPVGTPLLRCVKR